MKNSLRYFLKRISLAAMMFSVLGFNGYGVEKEKPLIYPIPLEVQLKAGEFKIDKTTTIILSETENKSGDFLARLLFNELVDKYGQPTVLAAKSKIQPKGKFILIGDLSDPLVRNYCDQKKLTAVLKGLGSEGYILSVSADEIAVVANNKSGALWGLASLRQIIRQKDNAIVVPQLIVKDKPNFPFRGIKLYLPGKENIMFFKRFIKDFVSLYKFNKIILELNANMRLERRPELNIGAVQFAKYLNYARLGRPVAPNKESQNSSHQDNADGQILEKEDVADLVNYMRKFGIEVIPELPSLTHSFYLLAGHKELAENLKYEHPDTYCPLKPEIYKIYFDVLDEYIEVIRPSIIHVGHDEWRIEKDVCELCKGKDYGELYAMDLNKIHGYLAKKGVKTAIWGDHLLESVTGKGHAPRESSTGYKYKIPGALTPQQVLKLIPKDILIFNWFWDDINNDKQVADFGFKQVYGNMRPEITNWSERRKIKGLMGGAPSSWAGTTDWIFGKDMYYEILADANLLWSEHEIPLATTYFITESLMSGIRKNMSDNALPSDDGGKASVLNISTHFNSSLPLSMEGQQIPDLATGDIKSENKTYHLSPPADKGFRAIVVDTKKDQSVAKAVKGIQVNKDVSSILFLHASEDEARNQKAYHSIFNVEDGAALLGWYEVVFEDGFIETIPLRYGVNILDWRWRQRLANNETSKIEYNINGYAYEARAVECAKDPSASAVFFAYEWKNSRFGKKIREVNLKSVDTSRGNGNGIILLAVSVIENDKKEDVKVIERF